MTIATCNFQTERLTVGPWHEQAKRCRPPIDLAESVSSMLTAAVTSQLPEPWRGSYSVERARAWVAERDAESPTLLAVDRAGGAAVGLVILFESPVEPGVTDGAVDLRLGYLVAEQFQGRGLAGELIAGLIDWCRGQPLVASISGGVAADNQPSRRVLENHGFVAADANEAPNEELLYRLALTDRR